MKQKSNDKLRQIAESKLKDKKSVSNPQYSEADTLKLIHELEVHQIELEMQNEELVLAQARAKDAIEKYTELYDFAPFGYFTLSKEGKIIELNLSGSKMLGKDREFLKNRMFTLFVRNDSILIFNNFLKKVFSSTRQQTCEVTLAGYEGTPVIVQLNSFIPENSENCWLSMVDITEKKLLQNAILNAILMSEEKEKANFSAELNESIIPLLSGINVYLTSIDTAELTQKQQGLVLMSKELINDAMKVVKEISIKLSPYILRENGLATAISDFSNKLNAISHFRINFASNLERRLPGEIETAIFQAAIEFIDNSVKYAYSQNINISLLDSDNQISLEYDDDGIGFDMNEIMSGQKSSGLKNIETRIKSINGKLTMSSKPGKGVHYEIVVDVDN